jgi:acrylyl-CoA reductase (NADPH)
MEIMENQSFKAMVVRETDNKKFVREIVARNIDDLPPGEVLIKITYSALNYKDALSATGNRGVTKKYPQTPGIDAVGVVAESQSERFNPGDEVIVTGFDMGMNTPGGFAEYVRVPASWPVKLPKQPTLKESMIYGTGGFTAALSLLKLEQLGLSPKHGPVLVTGATGGVGSNAVAILAKAGYQVTAATGKAEAKEFLLELGATSVITRDEANDATGKPLLKDQWAGVIDTVGGNILATALKSTRYGGSVACCGLVASPELHTTVYPFILRGVNLLGIETSQCSPEIRNEMWKRLSGEWKSSKLASIASECSLEQLEAKIELILQGKVKGRVVVVINSV